MPLIRRVVWLEDFCRAEREFADKLFEVFLNFPDVKYIILDLNFKVYTTVSL